MNEYYKGMIEDVINNYDIEENSSLEELIITFKYLCNENNQLKLINQEHQQINGELRQANKLLNEQYIRLYIRNIKNMSKVKDNWNMLKEYIRKNIIYDDVGMKILDPSPLEDYIQELEQGSDSDE